MELYKSLYQAEIEKNFETVNQKIVGFQQRFKNIKEKMSAKNYKRSDQSQKKAKVDKISHIAGIHDNLNDLYNFSCKLKSKD